MKRTILSAFSSLVAVGLLLQPVAAVAQTVTAQPQNVASGYSAPVSTYFRNPANDPSLTNAQLISLLRHRIKYVFVLFNENRSFDHYFGTFPGANGLFADASATPTIRTPATASNTQIIYNTNGTQTTITPFRIGTSQNAADLDDIDHGHPRMAAKMDLTGGNGTPKMDHFAVNEQFKYLAGAPILSYSETAPSTYSSSTVTLKSKQYGELAMAYVDCDTIPFMWNWANRFVLFDHIHQTVVGPSSPNAISMIAGQSGDTQWVKHPSTANAGSTTTNSFDNVAVVSAVGSNGVPVMNDPLPGLPNGATEFSGNPSSPNNISSVSTDTGASTGTPQRKNETGSASNVAPNLTFASIPLTLMGRTASTVTASDTNAAADLVDIQKDIPAIVANNTPAYSWGWYQNGYDTEPNLPSANSIASTPHASYIGHHNGPQYFGYVNNNPLESVNLHGLGDFFTAMTNQTLPSGGGVFYVRGGYDNIQNLVPNNANANGYGTVTAAADQAYVSANFLGDDDHPAYSDSQISEALVASEVNAIASSPYWSQSAIVITYDESEGDYDHVAPRVLSFDPAGLPLSRGPRIPLIVISPYARVHVVSHEEGDHNNVIGLINAVFNLNPLADLPDELNAKVAGQAAAFNTAGITQTNLGPHDGIANPTPGTSNLLSAFDPARLEGTAPALPASYAMIPAATITSLPHYGGAGCSALGITPIDTQLGITTTIPADFFPRPSQTTN